MSRTPHRRLLIVGGGHAHIHVLRALRERPLDGVDVTFVHPHAFATYSGMVPGYIAGQYRLRQTQIDVRELAAAADAELVTGRATAIDAAARRVRVDADAWLAYDVVSFDIGSQPAHPELVAADAPASMVKPIDVAAAAIDAALAQPRPEHGRRLVVVGAGAGGTEVAFALAARLAREGGGDVALVDRGEAPVMERGRHTSTIVARALAERGIRFLGAATVESVDAAGVVARDAYGTRHRLPAEWVVWATGAAAPALFRDSALATDARGFLWVGADLRHEPHPEIFAAGDCATLTTHPQLPKAGVYAVRQGVTLAHNLYATLRGEALRTYEPQKRFLSILNLGDGTAVASYAGWAWHGRSAWRLKDFIDRRFVARYDG